MKGPDFWGGTKNKTKEHGRLRLEPRRFSVDLLPLLAKGALSSLRSSLISFAFALRSRVFLGAWGGDALVEFLAREIPLEKRREW